MLAVQARTQLQALIGQLDVLRGATLPKDKKARLREGVDTVLEVLDGLDDAALSRVFDSENMRRYYRGDTDLGALGASGPRALIVEDDPTNTRVAIDMLSVLGLEADTASTGEEALEKVDTGAYDLVLMDVMLPTASGIEITAEIRRRSIRQPFVVGVSALPSAERDSLEAGMDAFLTKPMRLAEIAKTLGLRSAVDADGASPGDTSAA